MQTALFLTDCSVDAALALRRWQSENGHIPLRITVVHPFDLESGCRLTKETSRAIRQEARDRLRNWLAMVEQPLPAEILLGSADLVLTLHLRLRQYDYLLLCAGQEELTAAYTACSNQVDTQPIWINTAYEELEELATAY